MAVHTHGVTRAGGWKDRPSTIIPPPLPSLPLLDYWSDGTRYPTYYWTPVPNVYLPFLSVLLPFFFFKELLGKSLDVTTTLFTASIESHPELPLPSMFYTTLRRPMNLK